MAANMRALQFLFGACLALVVVLTANPASTKSQINPDDCSYNGHRLYGKFQVVDSFPDLKVQKVDSFPDLNVQLVDSFPNSCGKWQEVDSFPDFKIKYVDSFPDIKIKLVDSFPGQAP